MIHASVPNYKKNIGLTKMKEKTKTIMQVEIYYNRYGELQKNVKTEMAMVDRTADKAPYLRDEAEFQKSDPMPMVTFWPISQWELIVQMK